MEKKAENPSRLLSFSSQSNKWYFTMKPKLRFFHIFPDKSESRKPVRQAGWKFY